VWKHNQQNSRRTVCSACVGSERLVTLSAGLQQQIGVFAVSFGLLLTPVMPPPPLLLLGVHTGTTTASLRQRVRRRQQRLM
jgi:hypothetical protein